MVVNNFLNPLITKVNFSGERVKAQYLPITSNRPDISGKTQVDPAKYPTTLDNPVIIFFVIFFWSVFFCLL